MQFAVVDIETTGGRPGQDRITEIGIVLMNGAEIEETFSSLVDPECPIPAFIQKLTGITPALLQNAPTFIQIAERILSLLSGRVFVAHNVAFDYPFVQRELEKAGFPFVSARLCTVKLTRKAFPGHPSYSLGKIAEQLGWESWQKHRALGDAQASCFLLQQTIAEHGLDYVSQSIQGDWFGLNWPAGWSRERVLEIPDSVGLLWIYNRQQNLVYMSDARSLREKAVQILTHSGKRGSLAKVRDALQDIQWMETGSRLLAKLLMIQDVLNHKPSANRQIRIPCDHGPDLGNACLVDQGRNPSEGTLFLIKQNKLTGWLHADLQEGWTWEQLEAAMERFSPQWNLTPYVKSAKGLRLLSRQSIDL